MRIAITGAHRVGKTTLVENILESLPDYEYRAEPYYELEEAGQLFSETPTVDDFMDQLEYSIKQISGSGDHVIFDRCPIDLLAYIHAINENENIESLFHKVQSTIRGLDLLVFVPIEEPDRISCPESELPELRDQVNEILTDWIWDFGIETIQVTGSLSDRRDQVIDKIKTLRNDQNNGNYFD